MGSSSSQLSSSSQVVVNDDDLLTLILLRVPWKSLMSSKCVSRQWLSLITNPYFIRLRSLPPLRISGLFFQQHHHCDGENNKVYFVHLNHLNTPSPLRSLSFAHDRPSDPERICILRSCNGLLLCCTERSAACAHVYPHKRNYYVYNPSTNQLDTLPERVHHCLNRGYRLPHIDLIFDPSKSLHYKVISFLDRPQSDVGDFYIYSSETETWRPSINSYIPSPGMCFTDGVYWNGCLHWLSQYLGAQPVSDSFYFNVDEERLETFPSPPPISGILPRANFYFGESEGHLHYTEVRPYDSSFSVYEMKSDYSEWFVKYQIDLVPISKVFPMRKDSSSYIGKSYLDAAVVSIIRRESLKEDSFLVLELPGKFIRYNVVDKSFQVTWDFAAVVDLELQNDLRHGECGSFKAWVYAE